jgi:cell division protein FtsL
VDELEEANSDMQRYINGEKMVILAFTVALIGLIGIVVYVRRKKQEPYLVIRKETVALGEGTKKED